MKGNGQGQVADKELEVDVCMALADQASKEQGQAQFVGTKVARYEEMLRGRGPQLQHDQQEAPLGLHSCTPEVAPAQATITTSEGQKPTKALWDEDDEEEMVQERWQFEQLRHLERAEKKLRRGAGRPARGRGRF